MKSEKIGVVGAGSWGTTLANLLAKKGYDVTLWAYEPELVEEMRRTKVNAVYLPGVELSGGLSFTNELGEAVAEKDFLLFVPPSQVLRTVLRQALPYMTNSPVIASASKGIETDTLLLVSQIFEELLPPSLYERFGIISGPSFAKEVSSEMPTAVAAAAVTPSVADRIQELFTTAYFRVYTNDDVIGVELGGAVKNVIAIAAGMSDGLGFGHNTRAALITRGLAEITRLGQALGGKPATFAGLAGMGDLVLPCTGDLSRNRTVGFQLGQGKKLGEILSGMRMVAEGVKTTESTWNLARKLNVDMPLTEQIYRILYEDKAPREAVIELMTRNPKPELA